MSNNNKYRFLKGENEKPENGYQTEKEDIQFYQTFTQLLLDTKKNNNFVPFQGKLRIKIIVGGENPSFGDIVKLVGDVEKMGKEDHELPPFFKISQDKIFKVEANIDNNAIELFLLQDLKYIMQKKYQHKKEENQKIDSLHKKYRLKFKNYNQKIETRKSKLGNSGDENISESKEMLLNAQILNQTTIHMVDRPNFTVYEAPSKNDLLVNIHMEEFINDTFEKNGVKVQDKESSSTFQKDVHVKKLDSGVITKSDQEQHYFFTSGTLRLDFLESCREMAKLILGNSVEVLMEIYVFNSKLVRFSNVIEWNPAISVFYSIGTLVEELMSENLVKIENEDLKAFGKFVSFFDFYSIISESNIDDNDNVNIENNNIMKKLLEKSVEIPVYKMK